jgi:23S rRNA pseudouridine2605 synthase
MAERTLRINRYLSQCGLGSRRKVEALVLKGRIAVNMRVVNDLSRQVNPETDTVTLDGKALVPLTRKYYFMINKPRGCITTRDELENRSIVMDLIPERFREAGVFPVGRLDRDTEGLLILTNDGDLAFRLTHPRFGIEKEYTVTLNRPLQDEDRTRLERGVVIEGKRTGRAKIAPMAESGETLRITIAEGKKRQIRIMFSIFNYRVKKLKRVRFGPLRLSHLPAGSYRTLRESEVKALRSATGMIRNSEA